MWHKMIRNEIQNLFIFIFTTAKYMRIGKDIFNISGL